MSIRRTINIFIKSALLLLLFLSVMVSALAVYINSTKEEWAARLLQDVAKKHHLDIQVEAVELPPPDTWAALKIRFRNLKVISLKDNPGGLPVFAAENIGFSVDIIKLFQKKIEIKEISVRNGQILLEKDEAGKTNFALHTSDQSLIDQSFLINIGKVTLRNVSFDFYNRQSNKHIGFVFNRNSIELTWLPSAVKARLKGRLTFNELLFKAHKGPFLYNKRAEARIDFLFLEPKKWLLIDENSYAIIDRQKYHLSGLALMDSMQRMAMKIKGEVNDFQQMLTLLNSRIQKNLSLLKVENALRGEVFLLTRFNRDEDPLVKISFTGENNNVYAGTEKIPYTQLSFRGEFRCLPDSSGVPDMDKAWLTIYDLKGKVFDAPFNASLSVVNMRDPFLYCKAKLWADARKIRGKMPENFELSGRCRACLKYEGPLSGLSASTWLKPPMKLNGDVEFQNLKCTARQSRITFSVQGKAQFKNDDLNLKDLRILTEGGNLNISGKAKGFINYICYSGKAFKASLAASSKSLNLTPILKKVKRNRKAGDQDTLRVSSNDVEVDLAVQIKELIFRKMKASEASVSVRYTDDLIEINDLDFVACGGSLLAKGYVYNFSKAKASLELRSVDVKELFEQCEDFNQTAIISGNLRGTLSATGNVAMDLKDGFEPDISSLNADINAVIRNGHLINYEPLQNISSFIFRRRNFSDVSFSHLTPVLHIKGREVNFEQLEITSSVLNFFMSGTYHFSDESNLNLIVPWSNIWRSGRESMPRLKKKEGDSPKGLKLNVYGQPDKLRLRLGHN